MHPATWLLAWASGMVATQLLSPASLVLVSAAVIPGSALFAARRIYRLMFRARWLILSIALIFVLATPGERLAGSVGDMGLTRDGLVLAGEHVVRLLMVLATLAVLHEILGTEGIVAGAYWLLAPLVSCGGVRERIVVRMVLVLDMVENAPGDDWRAWLNSEADEPSHIRLAISPPRVIDWLTLVPLAFGMAYLVWPR